MRHVFEIHRNRSARLGRFLATIAPALQLLAMIVFCLAVTALVIVVFDTPMD
jgi:hypothetical protein